MINKIKTVLKNPIIIIIYLAERNIIPISDKAFIKMLYKYKFKKTPNLDNPQTFNEKLQWLKLHDRKDIYTTMVDKYEAKKYVADIIGDEYIIPTLGIYEKFDDIDFDKLPNKFVIKATHYGGGKGVYIVKDKEKENFTKIKKQINKILKRNLYYFGREWPYKNVKPRILIEEYITNNDEELNDYKFYCFNGKVYYTMLCCERNTGHTRFYYFDKKWNMIRNFSKDGLENYKDIKKPDNLKEMFQMAERLSKGMAFVRVDLYNIDGKIYFGELTLYPSGGIDNTRTKECENYLDNALDIKGLINEYNNKHN